MSAVIIARNYEQAVSWLREAGIEPDNVRYLGSPQAAEGLHVDVVFAVQGWVDHRESAKIAEVLKRAARKAASPPPWVRCGRLG